MYEQLESDIKKYLTKEDVISNDQMINAYDLRNSISQSMKELYWVIGSKNREGKIHAINMKKYTLWSITKREFAKKIYEDFGFILNYYPKDLTDIHFNSDVIDKYSKGTFRFEDYFDNYYIKVRKEYGKNDFYFDPPLDTKWESRFIKDHFEYIINSLQTVEKYALLFDRTIYGRGFLPDDATVQKYDDGFFLLTIDLSEGLIHIEPNQKVDPNCVYYQNVNNKPQLSKFVQNNLDIFLKKIEVPIYELNPNFKKLIEIQKEISVNQEPTKQKKIGGIHVIS